MAVVHDLFCPGCDLERFGVWVEYGNYGLCTRCGTNMKVSIGAVNHAEWGGPKQLTHLRDEPFADKAELKSWTERNGAAPSPSADKHHGARNEGHRDLGKLYSGGGLKGRGGYGKNYGSQTVG